MFLSTLGENGGWRCPGCQNINQGLPNVYKCFCGMDACMVFFDKKIAEILAVTFSQSIETCYQILMKPCFSSYFYPRMAFSFNYMKGLLVDLNEKRFNLTTN